MLVSGPLFNYKGLMAKGAAILELPMAKGPLVLANKGLSKLSALKRVFFFCFLITGSANESPKSSRFPP
jgi:hypothetical protein